MWATVASIFVFKEAGNQSLRAGIGRFFATSISFVLTLIYFLLFPFTPSGMAIIIGLGTLLVILLGRREDIITTAITTCVIMIVGGMGPSTQAWFIPILRLMDTIIGIVIGLGCWWLNHWLQIWIFSRSKGRRTSTASL